MTFKLPYICKSGRNHFINLPNAYLGFVCSEDANQINHGLSQNTDKKPSQQTLRQSAINLAKQRRDRKNDGY